MGDLGTCSKEGDWREEKNCRDLGGGLRDKRAAFVPG